MPWGLAGGGPQKYLYDRPAGAIKRLLEIPCAPTPMVYIEATAAAAIEMFISYVSPDYRELYTKGTGKSIFCDVEGTIHQVQRATGGKIPQLERFLFKIAKKVDISTYWYFLASIIADGVIDWATIARKLSECGHTNDPNAGAGYAYIGAIPDDGSWGGQPFSFDPPSKYAPASPAGVTVPPGWAYILSASCSWRSSLGTGVPTLSRIVVKDVIAFDDGPTPMIGDVLDHHQNTVDMYGTAHPNHVWTKGVNPANAIITYEAQWAYAGGMPLPYHEAFPKPDDMFCFQATWPRRPR